jgi:hypothetical protein
MLSRDAVPELLGVEPARRRGRDGRHLPPCRCERFAANVARHDVGKDESEDRHGDRREDADAREQSDSGSDAPYATPDAGPSTGVGAGVMPGSSDPPDGLPPTSPIGARSAPPETARARVGPAQGAEPPRSDILRARRRGTFPNRREQHTCQGRQPRQFDTGTIPSPTGVSGRPVRAVSHASSRGDGGRASTRTQPGRARCRRSSRARAIRRSVRARRPRSP